MKDRVPGMPGQYKAVVTDAELQKMHAGEQFTITMTRDDQPIVEGTPYSKAAVLPDELAQQLCPGMDDPTPADALKALNDRCKTKAGLIYPLASDVVPKGFLLCNGAAYSREEYPELFAAIGTIYGEGDGQTTFNVPNLATRVPVGTGEGYGLGATGGEAEHTLTVAEMPSHAHPVVFDTPNKAVGYRSGTAEADQSVYFAENTLVSGARTGTLTTKQRGDSQPHNNMPPYMVVNYIIATGKDTAVSVADIVLGAQAIPLGIEYGGTGATDAATARALLGMTPKNIGALPLSGGTMTGPLDMGWKSIVNCQDFRSVFINGARIRAYDFSNENIPFVLDRGGHCAYLVVGRTNSGVCVYAVRVDQGGSTPEVIKMCGGQYANFGFLADATSLTITGSSYATCVVFSIDNWNV